MNYISNILKGILIGIANIIPGVSGGTIAVSMGIYDKIIHAVTHFFKEPKKSILTLMPYGIGVLVGIVGLSFTIEYLFEYYPLQTSLTFVGLILGGLPSILDRVRGKKIPFGGYLIFLFTFAVVIGMALISGGSAKSVDLSFHLIPVILLFFVGMIAAATMVIPGVSGSMLLMLLGYYQPIIASINHFMIGMATMDISIMLAECAVLVPFGLGIVVGIFACAKLIELLLSRYERMTYCAIIGLVVASPIVILLGVSPAALTLAHMVTGLLCFTLSLVFAIWLSKKDGEAASS